VSLLYTIWATFETDERGFLKGFEEKIAGFYGSLVTVNRIGFYGSTPTLKTIHRPSTPYPPQRQEGEEFGSEARGLHHLFISLIWLQKVC
jgi:hypothetical protein